MTPPTPDYPSKQPFPSRTAVRIGQEQQDDLFHSAGKLITYQTAPFGLADRALRAYFEQYSGETIGDGMTLGIYGPYGSGKTHLVRWLHQDAVVVWNQVRQPSPQVPQQIYAKVDTDDFLDLYRTIVRQIDSRTLQDINTKLLSKLAQKEVAKSETTKDLGPKLQQQPQQVFELLRNTLISESDIQKPQMQWVRKITGAEDFLHFAAWLADPALGDSAVDWLQAEKLSENRLSRMGIKAPINTSGRALAGLAFLISVFAEVRCPLLLYIDQVERLLPAKQPKIRGDNAPVIQSLAEWAQEKQAFLCVAGATTAATPDFPGRFSVMARMPSLDSNGAANLLKAYLDATGSVFVPYESEVDIYPYTFPAVEEMVQLVGGSMRGILRLAFLSYAIASPNRGQIGPETIDQAFRKFEEYFDERAIVAKIKELVAETGFSFTEQPSVGGGPRADLAVFDGRELVAYLEVVNAIFDDDEALRALDFTKLAQSIRASSPDAKLVLVAAGYLSPQVQSQLSDTGPGRTVDHYLVYAPDRFEDEFRLVLQALAQERQRRSASASSAAPIDVMGPINDLKVYFEKVLDERLGTAESRQQRIAGAASIQASADKARSSAEIGTRQAAFRSEEQVRAEKARHAREDRENQERDRLRTQGEEERKRGALERTCWSGAAVILLAVAAVLLSWQLSKRYIDPSGYLTREEYLKAQEVPSSIYWIPILIGIAVSGLAYAFSMRLFGPGSYSRLVRATRAPVPALADLDDIAVRLGRRPDFDRFVRKSSNMEQSLNDPNPQVRYAAARILELNKKSGRIDLFRRLRAENWIKAEVILLRVLTGQEQDDPSTTWVSLREHLSYATAPEALYTIDALSRLQAKTQLNKLSSSDLKRYPSHVLLHALFSSLVDPLEIRPEEADSGRERFILELALGYNLTTQPSGPAARLGSLLRKFPPDHECSVRDLNAFNLESLSWQRIEEAMALFGPGGVESLGDYEDLAKAFLYRQIYDLLFQVRLALFELS
jgi:hypothetical protein